MTSLYDGDWFTEQQINDAVDAIIPFDACSHNMPCEQAREMIRAAFRTLPRGTYADGFSNGYAEAETAAEIAT